MNRITVIMIMRVYAFYDENRWILSMLVLVGLIDIGICSVRVPL